MTTRRFYTLHTYRFTSLYNANNHSLTSEIQRLIVHDHRPLELFRHFFSAPTFLQQFGVVRLARAFGSLMGRGLDGLFFACDSGAHQKPPHFTLPLFFV